MQAESSLPAGTVSLLCTDIEGSTRLLESLGERYAEALAEHRCLLRAAFREHSGHEVDTQGDASFYGFPRAHDAVAGAAAAQRALASHIWPEGLALRVRIGIHTGEPTATGEGDADEYGEACTLFEQSLDLRRKLGDKRNMANSLCYLGSVALLEGDYNRATALLGESLALGRELGNVLIRVQQRACTLRSKRPRPRPSA